MRNPEKHFGRHELHRTGLVRSPSAPFFPGQVEIDEHALKAVCRSKSVNNNVIL